MAKIKLKQVPESKLKNRPNAYITSKQRKMAEPFAIARCGILVHRVRAVLDHYTSDGTIRHTTSHFWCAAMAHHATPLAEVPHDRLLCARCEAMATQHGEKTAKDLCGRHVHIGGLRAVKLCCNHNN